MSNFAISFLPEDSIWKSAEERLHFFGVQDEIPVPIEHIIERMGMDIVPVPGLKRHYEIDGFTTHDMKEIRVDETLWRDCEVRLRFTLAHELGHMTLHRFLFTESVFSNLEEWRAFISNGITPADYNRLEIQSDMFAGLFLAPKPHLEKHFKDNLPSILPSISAAKDKGINKDSYLTYAISMMARILRPTFNLSEEALHWCIIRDKLERLVP